MIKWILWTVLGLIILLVAPYLISMFLMLMFPGFMFLMTVWAMYKFVRIIF